MGYYGGKYRRGSSLDSVVLVGHVGVNFGKTVYVGVRRLVLLGVSGLGRWGLVTRLDWLGERQGQGWKLILCVVEHCRPSSSLEDISCVSVYDLTQIPPYPR